MNVLILYNSTQTFTNTVYEHLASFAEHSRHRVFFSHVDQYSELDIDFRLFDAVGIHFTVRLPFDQISPSVSKALESYGGLKFLFIQDEYDHPKRAWHWIKKLGMQLVFTVVPGAGIGTVYPKHEFPNTRFVTNLTGYVPEKLPPTHLLPLPSERSLIVGYRGRPLPIRYGQLGLEKIAIGEIVKSYCDQYGVKNDIAWSEEARIYGAKWYDFVVSCRSMLGSESGSNVFDWDGTLIERIAEFRKRTPRATDQMVYEKFVSMEEHVGLMNQVSPRIFEAIAARTVLVLFEGEYSGVVRAGEHFIGVKKDGSNIAEVMDLLQNGAYVDAMAERAYRDVIASGKYSYESFVAMVDDQLELSFKGLAPVKERFDREVSSALSLGAPFVVTTSPIRAMTSREIGNTFLGRFAVFVWLEIPENLRLTISPVLKRILGRK